VVDFADAASLRPVVQGCQIVFHLAGVLNEFKPYSYYQQVNVTGTQVLADLAVAAGVERFIHTSTVWVYGMNTAGLIDETAPRIKSGNFYADSKLEGEEIVHRLVKERNLPAVIVLPSQAYGPADPSWTIRPLELISSGRLILVSGGTGLIQPIYIDDLVEGIILAAKRGMVGQSYILCGETSISIREYFSMLTELTGKKKLHSIPKWLAMSMARTAESWAGLFNGKPVFTRQEVQATLVGASYKGDKARTELGFKPKVNLETGMARIKQWLASGDI
jgi:nucleoside-diphosphate-sugar epimerase